MAILLFLFIGIPLIEISLLVKMGEVIGFWPTIFIQIGTGALGATLARLQGWLIWNRVAQEIQAGHLPAEQLVDGILIFAAGLVLLTPGLLTDAVGFLVLFPLTRHLFKVWLRKKFNRMAQSRDSHVTMLFGP